MPADIASLRQTYDEVGGDLGFTNYFYLRYLEGAWWAYFLSFLHWSVNSSKLKKWNRQKLKYEPVKYDDFVSEHLNSNISFKEQEIEEKKDGYNSLTIISNPKYSFTAEQAQQQVKQYYGEFKCPCNFPQHIDPNQNKFYVTCTIQGTVKCTRGENIKDKFKTCTKDCYSFFNMVFQYTQTQETLKGGQVFYKPEFISCDYDPNKQYDIKTQQNYHYNYYYHTITQNSTDQKPNVRLGGIFRNRSMYNNEVIFLNTTRSLKSCNCHCHSPL